MQIFAFTKKRVVLVGAIAAVGISLFFLSGGSSATDEIEVQAVTRGTVSEVVSETGFVAPVREVNLGFERGGKVGSVSVSEGDEIAEGSTLVTLDTSEQSAELSAARARLQAERLRLDELLNGADEMDLSVLHASVRSAEVALRNAEADLEETIKQHNQLVANAQETLLTDGLEAHLVSGSRESTSYSYTAPTITGTYEGSEEGTYVLELYRSGAQSGASFRLSGLETGVQSISTSAPVPLGTRGLFIQFPEDFAKGHNVVWEVPIPNPRSSTYSTNRNAYEAARDARNVAVEKATHAVASAEAALQESRSKYAQAAASARDERVQAQSALVQQMQASVDGAKAALRKMTLTAPFSGTVTSVAVEEGEIASPAASVVSLISDDDFELTVQIAESDIAEVRVDDAARVRLDAYKDTQFDAHVVRIAPSAKIIEGVRVFEVTLRLAEASELLRAGLSADIDIFAAERRDVLTVPSRAVVEREDGKFVRTLEGGRVTYLPVETGLRGSDGMTEIISGLEEGTEIITFAPREAIEALEAS